MLRAPPSEHRGGLSSTQCLNPVRFGRCFSDDRAAAGARYQINLTAAAPPCVALVAAVSFFARKASRAVKVGTRENVTCAAFSWAGKSNRRQYDDPVRSLRMLRVAALEDVGHHRGDLQCRAFAAP